jgi:pimeloyl-ACP methyl ester carboxylesterase
VRVGVGDARLYVDVDGAKLVPAGPWMRERPTVVLLHPGPGFDHTVYKEFVGPALAEVAQVVYVDLRGHGRSDRSTPDRLTIAQFADDLDVLVQTLGIERPILYGQGWGGFTAMLYAHRRPDGLEKLVLVNPAARIDTARSVAVFDRIAGPDAGEAARRFYEEPTDATFAEYARLCFPHMAAQGRLAAEAVVRAEWNPAAAVQWFQGAERFIDLRSELAGIRVPTLVLAGEDDPLMTIAAAEELVASFPPGVVELHRFPGARHAVIRDSPESVRILCEFVARTTADAEPAE